MKRRRNAFKSKFYLLLRSAQAAIPKSEGSDRKLLAEQAHQCVSVCEGAYHSVSRKKHFFENRLTELIEHHYLSLFEGI